VLGLINKSGGVAVTYTYDPYGNTTSTGGPNTALAAGNAFRYASGDLDTATGLYKLGARYYQPTRGHWTQQDTLNIIGDPANGNRYTAPATSRLTTLTHLVSSALPMLLALWLVLSSASCARLGPRAWATLAAQSSEGSQRCW